MPKHQLELDLQQQWPAGAENVTTLVGVSGGPDSVALLRGLCNLPQTGTGKLIVAHYNHGIRGEQSGEDAQFVRQLADELQLELQIETAAHSETDEQSLRNARHEFFRRTADATGARYVTLAHTANDQAETVLHRILRGTGLAGLAGIPRVRKLSSSTSIIRPLLTTSRSSVLDYLRLLEQDYRTDSSNYSTNYTRNRIRHELLPLLRENYNSEVETALLRLAEVAKSNAVFVGSEIQTLLEKATLVWETDRVHLSRNEIPQDTFLLCELLRKIWQQQQWPQQEMSQVRWERLASTALEIGRSTTTPGKIQLSSDIDQIRIWK